MTNALIKEQFAFLIASLNRRLEDELEGHLKPGGVPIDQFRVLEVLDAHDNIAMGELATRTLIEPPTLTKVIDKMVTEGLVDRAYDTADRRRVMIMTAAAGATLYRRLRRASAAQEERMVEYLSASKASELKQVLRELMTV